MSKAKKQKNANKHRALSAQQTIPYIAMHPDGICQLPGGLYTKTLEYEDINLLFFVFPESYFMS